MRDAIHKIGWFTPTKRFVECDAYAHLSVIASDKELSALAPKVADQVSLLAGIERSCRDAIDEDEHPEWHRYEIAADDAMTETWKSLLDAGCVRVGSGFHFEGRPQSLKELHATIVEFCGDAKPTFEPM